jgi:thiamine-phosphate pyrophosphorylase
VIRYAITGARFGGAVDFIQVRAKELSGSALTRLTWDILDAAAPGVRVLVNDRADIAIACGCAGVHLRGDSISPVEIRRIAPKRFVISVSCHSIDDVLRADAEGADLALLAPIFASPGKGEPLGLDYLAEATHAARIPVLALGGVTFENAAQCVAAGARGVAGIRLFAP